MSKTSDITDHQVVTACKQFHDSCGPYIGQQGKAPWQILMEQTGCPEKVVYSAMERAERRGLIDYGVSLRTGWPTEKGLELLKDGMNGYSFTLPAEQAERLKRLFEDAAAEAISGNYQGHRIPSGILDMSSDELHVTNECLFCDHIWMDKVKPAGECPACKRAYTMEYMPDGDVSIGWKVTQEEAERFKNKKP